MAAEWQPAGAAAFVASDGDNAGHTVAKLILKNKTREAAQFSKRINQADRAIRAEAQKRMGARPILFGGDDLLLKVEAKRFAKEHVEALRAVWAKVTGGTMTAGVGNTMAEAAKALLIGKHTGKNKTVYWDPAMESRWEKLAKEESVQIKLTQVKLTQERREDPQTGFLINHWTGGGAALVKKLLHRRKRHHRRKHEAVDGDQRMARIDKLARYAQMHKALATGAKKHRTKLGHVVADTHRTKADTAKMLIQKTTDPVGHRAQDAHAWLRLASRYRRAMRGGK